MSKVQQLSDRVTTRCKEHRSYKAIHPPRDTHKHRGGCVVCWLMFREANEAEHE